MAGRGVLLYVLGAAILVSAVQGETVGTGFSFQGRLHHGGNPADGFYDMQFRLFSEPDGSAGSQVGGTVLFDDIEIVDGYYQTQLDFGQGVFDGGRYWLEAAVGRGDSAGPEDYTVLLPRQEIRAVPYALWAQRAGLGFPVHVIGEDAGPGMIVENSGDGEAVFANSPFNYGVVGRSATKAGVYGAGHEGVRGEHLDTGNYGYLADQYVGVYGENAGGNFGMLGSDGSGVYGEASESGDAGVFGSNPFGYGVRGASASKYGVYGTGSKGVYGENPSSGNYGYLADKDVGVYGRHSGGNYGILGQMQAGVFGETQVTDAAGVLGSSPYGYGVQGASAVKYGVYGTGATGVYGANPSSGNFGYLGSSSYGVYGKGSPAVYAEAKNGSAFASLGSTNIGGHFYNNSAQIGVSLATNSEAVYANNPNGDCMFGESLVGKGVYGKSRDKAGVYGESSQSYGVYGTGAQGGVAGETMGAIGKLGYGGSGVWGEYTKGSGMVFGAMGNSGAAVDGYSEDPSVFSGRFNANVVVGGMVGVGDTISPPRYSIDVRGNSGAFVSVDGGSNLSGYRIDEAGARRWLLFFRQWQSDNLIVRDEAGSRDTMTFESGTGCVGIGTSTPKGTLDVNGSIYQRGGQLHADYVFDDGFKLESIKEHGEKMWSNKHLPAIPQMQRDDSGAEVVEVGSHRRGIVEELEKAHIYIEQMDRRNDELAAENRTLQARVEKLERVVEGLIAD